jgi:putative ABC transport system permease protein
VVIEVTLAVVLLAGAGVLIKSFWLTVQVDPGFDVVRLERFSLLPGRQSWETATEIDDYYAQLQDRIRALPGVEDVATVLAIPMVTTGYDLPVWRDAEPPVDGAPPPSTRWRPVSAGYFRTAGVRLLAGRRFEERDAAESEAVTVLNRAAVRRYYGANVSLNVALGDIIASVGYRARVIGVVEDVKMLGLRQPPPEAFYEPLPQANHRVHRFGFLHNRAMLVRSDLPPQTVEPSLRAAVADHDPLASVLGLEPMDRVVATSLAQSRSVMVLLAGFAMMALILGAIGVYGVMGYTVTERSREMGVRLALGAEVSSVIGMVMGIGLKMVGLGVLLGGLLGVGLTRLLSSELFEVEPTDPLSFAVAVITIVAVAAIAILVPARRAGRIDPAEVLRAE